MKDYETAYSVIVPVAAVLAGLMLFRHAQGSFPEIAEETRRSDMGLSCLFGLASGMIWPLLLPAVFCLTGFAEHGIFRQKAARIPRS